MSSISPLLEFNDLPKEIQGAFNLIALELMRNDEPPMFWEELLTSGRLQEEIVCKVFEFLSTLSQEELGYHPAYNPSEYFFMINLEELCRKLYSQTLLDINTEFDSLKSLYAENLTMRNSENKLIKIDKSAIYENFSWHVHQGLLDRIVFIRIFPYSWLKKNNISTEKLSNILNKINQSSQSVSLSITPNPFLIHFPARTLIKLEKQYGVLCPSFEHLINLQGKSFADHYHPNASDETFESRAKFFWEGTDDSVELKCEALDTVNPNLCSLFLHAVIDKSKGDFVHMDGAIYQYSQDNYQCRLNAPPDHKVKADRRKKVFRIDGAFSFQAGIELVEAFFCDCLVNEYLQIEKSY